MIRQTLAAAALIACLGAGSTAFAAEDMTRVVVKISDLDLTTARDQTVARQRIDAAIADVCANQLGQRVSSDKMECRASLTAKFKSRLSKASAQALVIQEQAGIAAQPKAVDQPQGR